MKSIWKGEECNLNTYHTRLPSWANIHILQHY